MVRDAPSGAPHHEGLGKRDEFEVVALALDVAGIVMPADDKHNARLIISQIVLDMLESLDLKYPKADKSRIKELESLRRQLER